MFLEGMTEVSVQFFYLALQSGAKKIELMFLYIKNILRFLTVCGLSRIKLLDELL